MIVIKVQKMVKSIKMLQKFQSKHFIFVSLFPITVQKCSKSYLHAFKLKLSMLPIAKAGCDFVGDHP